MAYSRDFFDLQIRFARVVADRFRLDFGEALFEYTTLAKTLASGEEWGVYLQGLKTAENETDWTYAFYLPRRGPEITAEKTTFHGHLLFGCFYFELRDGHIIRPHFIKAGTPKNGWFGKDKIATRQAELKRMFTHIREQVPGADTVLGNSWMYNLEAYRRLYPPTYTETMGISPWDEFQFLARWGQFFDRQWNVKQDLAQELFRRVESLTQLEDLRTCFPFQILQPQCAIQDFYAFYDITDSP